MGARRTTKAVSALLLVGGLFACAAGTPRPETLRTVGGRPSASQPPLPVVTQAPPIPPLVDPALLPISRQVLRNDLEVLHGRATTLPWNHVRLVIRAGSGHEARAGRGAAIACAMALARGVSGTEAVDGTDAFMAPIRVRVSRVSTVFSVEVAREQLPIALERLARIVEQKMPDPADLTAAIRALQSERRSGVVGLRDAESVLRALLDGSDADSAKGILPAPAGDLTPEECGAFTQAHYAPNNASLVVLGSVERAPAQTAARKSFGGLQGRANRAPASGASGGKAPRPRMVIIDTSQNQANGVVLMGARGPGVGDPAWPALWIASRGFSQPKRAGRFDCAELSIREHVVSCAAAPIVSLPAALQRMLGARERWSMAEPPKAELDVARSGVVHGLSVRFRSQGAIADTLADARALGLPHDTPRTWSPRVRRVTGSEVTRALRDFVKVDQLVVVAVGSAAKLGEGLARYGEVEVLDPTRHFRRKTTIPAWTGKSP